MTRDPLVQVRGLSKRFDVSPPWLNRVIERKPRQMLNAVDGVSLALKPGVVGLIGQGAQGSLQG